MTKIVINVICKHGEIKTFCKECNAEATMTDETKRTIETYRAGCVECTAGLIASRCDGVDHADIEIQRCDTCATLPDDNAAAVRLVRLAEWLAPDALESLAAAVATEIWRNPTDNARVETDADGLTTVTIYTNAE